MSYNIGLRTKTINGENNIFDSEKIRWITGAITLDESKVREISKKKTLSIGEFLGKITATGKYAPVKRSALNAAAASTDTVITLDSAVMGGAARFQAGDVLDITGTAATIQSIDYDTHQVTLTAQLGVAKNAGDAVKVSDGSETAVLVLGTSVDFSLGNGSYGDQVATAFDWARVLDARLPRQADATIKSELSGITFS